MIKIYISKINKSVYNLLLFSVICTSLNSQVIIPSIEDSNYYYSLWNKGQEQLMAFHPENALPIFLLIDSIAQKWQDEGEQVDALNFIAYTYFKLEDYDKTITTLDNTNEFIQNSDLLSSSAYYTDLFYLYGLVYKEKGNYENALYFFEKVIESSNVNSMSFRKDDLYGNMALIFNKLGDYKKSDDYYKQAILEIDSLSFKVSNRDRSNRFKNMAINLRDWGEPELAYQNFQLGLGYLPKKLENVKDLEKLVLLYNNLGLHFTKLKDFNRANYFFSKTEQFQLDNYLNRDLVEKRGLLKKEEILYTEAIKSFEEALVLSKEIEKGKHPNNSKYYNQLGEIYALQGKHHQALNNFQLSLINLAWKFNDSTSTNNPLLDNINAPPLLFQTLNLKAAALAAIGNLPKALETYQLAAELIDLKCNHYLATEESRLFWIAKAKPLYEKAIEIAQKLDQKEIVFDFIQRGHGLLLLQHMQQAAAIFNTTISDSLKKQDLSYKMSKSALDSRLLIAQKEGNQEKIQEFEIQKLELDQKNEQLHKYLKAQYPKYAQAVSTFPHKSIKTIRQEVLTNENALVEYFIGEKNIYTLVLTKDDLQIFKTHKSGNFVKQISIFRRLVQQYDYSLQAYTQFCKIGFDLYETLLKQVLTQLSPAINELIIIPDEQLNYISFAAILDAPVDVSEQVINYFELPYLIKKYAISYNYSSSLFGKLVNEGNTNEVVGFAPSFGGAYSTNRNLDSLIYNTEEVQIVDSIVGGQIYLRDDATLAAFKENITRSNILHLATHASVNDSLPMDSYIYFFKDSLPIHEIPTLRQSLNLAVLSACETGKGMLKKGEGIISLARAFIQSGCPSVVTSLWKVNDPKTPALMKHFYLELKSGKSKNVALSIAQKKYMSEEAGSDAYAHPYYWATFIQIGDTSPLFVDKKCLTILFMTTFISAFLLFIAWNLLFKQRF